MEKSIPNSTNTVTSVNNTLTRNEATNSNPLLAQRKLTKDELDRKNAEISADIKAEKNKPKIVFDTSKFFDFELGKTYTIQFDPTMTRIDTEYVYGKVRRKADGTLDKGPNGELYNPDTGEVIMSKFKDKNGNLRPVRPAKRYIYYGWHLDNKEEEANPLRLTLNADYAQQIQNYIGHTTVFEITKQIKDSKYAIMAVLGGSQHYEEQQDELTEEEAQQAQRDYEASRGQQ